MTCHSVWVLNLVSHIKEEYRLRGIENRVLRIILDVREDGENCIMRTSIIYPFYQILIRL
jgi:hypothetical protein